MAMLRPAWMQATGGDPDIEYNASQDRRVLQAIFSREGVLDRDAGQLRVQQRGAGANFSVDIAAGECAIYGDDVSDQGAYQCTSTATENRSVPSPPGSGSRTHRVVARIRDKMHNGVWTGYDWALEVLQDTGSGTPAVPPSAIPLGRVTVAAGQSSVTNANITDDRPRASVGTPWLTGNLLEGGLNPAYGGRDATRPLTWMKSPDGFVTLSGWFRRSGGNTNCTQNTTYWFDGNPGTNNPGLNPFLPAEIRPAGIRDFIGLTSNGYVHFAVYPAGTMSFRFNYNTTLAQNLTWFTLDGCTYRANAFS